MDGRRAAVTRVDVLAVRGARRRPRTDAVCVEEPLEIRLWPAGAAAATSVSVTMRTPGADFELAAGFLFSEGILSGVDDVLRISYCVDPREQQQHNIVNVYLRPGRRVDLERLTRHFYASSSCGVCGKASLEAIRLQGARPVAGDLTIGVATLASLPDALRRRQPIFERTGGLHAAALFDPAGELLVLREDVGRHNAVDKVLGERLLAGALPAGDAVLLVSGRAGFEIVQKAVAAGVPVLCSVSAPSSLAVDLAREFHLTLVGFLRGDGFNVYAGAERVGAGGADSSPAPLAPGSSNRDRGSDSG